MPITFGNMILFVILTIIQFWLSEGGINQPLEGPGQIIKLTKLMPITIAIGMSFGNVPSLFQNLTKI